jgi:hypothetical protein
MNNELKTREDIFTALAQGKMVQYSDKDGGSTWSDIDSSVIVAFRWRIKPEPKKVQLGPDDIDLHRDLFRFTVAPKKVYVATANGTDTVTINNHAYPFFALRDSVERSIDGGLNWQRCEKEVVQ